MAPRLHGSGLQYHEGLPNSGKEILLGKLMTPAQSCIQMKHSGCLKALPKPQPRTPKQANLYIVYGVAVAAATNLRLKLSSICFSGLTKEHVIEKGRAFNEPLDVV